MNSIGDKSYIKGEFMPSELLARHESLFKSYYKPLVVYATRMVNDQEDAEDIVQEVFAKLWNKKEDLEYGDKIVSYLFGAVKNACFNQSRHLKVVRKYENELRHQNDHLDNPHHYLMLHEIEKKIEATLDSLPEKTKDIFILSRYEQKKNKEIADLLNISIKTVEAHMTKVLSALKRNLKHYISIVVLIFIIA